MFGWIGTLAAGKWQVLFWTLMGLLSLPVSAWSKSDAVRAAGKNGVFAAARERAAREVVAPIARDGAKPDMLAPRVSEAKAAAQTTALTERSEASRKPERLTLANVTADPFADDDNPRKDPINRAATRIVRMPINKDESVHLNVMGQVLKLSFKIKNKANREGEADRLMRFLHSGGARTL